MRWFYVFLVSIFTLVLFQNGTPFFPRNNINTVVVQKQGADNKYRTTTPHIPANEFTRDGLIALRRRSIGVATLFPMKPNRVINHLQDPANALVGANIMNPNDLFFYNYLQAAKNNLSASEKSIADGFSLTQTLLCEKTKTVFNPDVCGGNNDHDCYRLTLIGKLSKPLSSVDDDATDSEEASYLRLISLEVIVKVQYPKTNNARISSITPYDPDGNGPLKPEAKLSQQLPNFLLNEPTITGDNRLLIARVGAGTATYKDASGTLQTLNNANIIYSVYSKDEAQCDVTKWIDQHPITYAHYDDENEMPNRYKFARYPLFDSAGNPYARGQEFGGSYPWMDRNATNLFFTAFGLDTFYNFVNGTIRTPYSITDATGSLISIDQSSSKPTNFAEISNYEAVGSRTMGIGFAGFWTHGKAVILDGLINNVDYNFSITSERANGTTINPTVNRRLALYTNTPADQTNELVGAGRERNANIDYYDPNLTSNSTFIGSIENRLNYHKKVKPISARDIVWHFGTTRHQEELVFDDYINPYFLINAEMTGVAAIDTNNSNRSMKHFDGYNNGNKSNPVADYNMLNTAVTALNSAPFLFQNSATGPTSFINAPYFGIPIGDVRLEPIAKGGIFGKGVWLEKNTGLSFTVPSQKTNSLVKAIASETSVPRYISVFIDPRYDSQAGAQEQKIFSHITTAKTESIQLVPVPGALTTYGGLTLRVNNELIASFPFPSGFSINSHSWSHLAVQFRQGTETPQVYLNGMYIGNIQPLNANNTLLQKFTSFFKPNTGSRIILGSPSASQLLGTRGWFDDFKLTLREPTSEEKCNYARGTLVQVNQPHVSTTVSANTANKYPVMAHRLIATDLGQELSGQRFLCHTKYSAQGSPNQLLNSEPFAHLKNLPADTFSVRDDILMGSYRLVYNQPRPNFSNNRFCLSCHLSPDYIPFKRLNTNALVAGTVQEKDDPRRQPMQPPRFIRGIIPANYFSPGVPASELKLFYRENIDRWILPD